MEAKHINFENGTDKWIMSVYPDGEVCVTCNGETRYYDVDTPILDVRHEDEYVHVDVEGGKTYQFKFEADSFLVGDIYRTSTGEMQDTFACHVFGENL